MFIVWLLLKDYLNIIIFINGVYDIICGFLLYLGYETPQTFIYEEEILYNHKLILAIFQR